MTVQGYSGFRTLSDNHHAMKQKYPPRTKMEPLTNPKGPCGCSIHAEGSKKLPFKHFAPGILTQRDQVPNHWVLGCGVVGIIVRTGFG